ncbi:A.superbus venom factor 1-like [Leucoraja erinacea]|uniref:A.superbus venom factor 1-like n=1 Tax=Leucoraja erinaceus TaxID=7782 RepID=UPI002455E123|nr:A.superbus venom factor 1-like [Leucoraja erinacea]
MKPYFTPGARFYIPISVTYPNGSPAINVSLHVNISILEEVVIKGSIGGTTDSLGEMIFSLTVPVNARILNVTASAGSASGETVKHRTVKKHESDSGRYLSINVPQALLYPEDVITVNLTALGLHCDDDVQYFYYMVLGKGRTLDIQRVEKRSETSFELLITAAMVPYFRIVAYYPLNVGGRWSIVADSVRVEAESLCYTKFQVHAVSHLPELHQLQLTVLSDTTAQIFVKTTDVRLKALEEDDSITHRRVFEDLNSTDIGLSSGGGSNPANVFKDSGLIFSSNLMTPSPEPDVSKLKQRQESLWRNGNGHGKVHITLKDPGRHDVEWVRPLFPGTSMWQFETYPGNNTFRLGFDPHPPESLDFQALSLSEEDGLCLASPLVVQADSVGSQMSDMATPRRGPHLEEMSGQEHPSTAEDGASRR